MKKPPTHRQTAQACYKAAQLARHSIEQAKTALELSAALCIERLRSMCPPADDYDIRRLAKHMAELREKLVDPVEAMKLASEKGILDTRYGHGEGFAKPTLRKACASLVLEIKAASQDFPAQIDKAFQELVDLSEDHASGDEAVSRTNRTSALGSKGM